MTTTKIRRTGSRTRGTSVLAGVCMGALILGGCDNAGQGLFTGAALGAASGTALGSLSGDAGEGAIIGTIVGDLGGAIIGDQNERNARANGTYRSDHYRDGGYSDPHDNRYRSSRRHSRDPWWEHDCDW